MQPEKTKLLSFTSPQHVKLLDLGEGRLIWGITPANWGKVLGCLVTLYVFLGLLYGALLSIAVDVRQEEWLELPRVHFGPFDKTERVLVDANTEQPLLKQGLPNDALENIEVLAQGDLPFRKFNRPRGCEDAQVNSIDVLVCDVTHEEADHRWTVYPWIVDKGFDASDPSILSPLCQFVSGEVAQYTTILNRDGTYSSNACFNGIITGSIPPLSG